MDKLVTFRLVQRLKKMKFPFKKLNGELNQNQIWKESEYPDTMWELYLAFEINQWYTQHNRLH